MTRANFAWHKFLRLVPEFPFYAINLHQTRAPSAHTVQNAISDDESMVFVFNEQQQRWKKGAAKQPNASLIAVQCNAIEFIVSFVCKLFYL